MSATASGASAKPNGDAKQRAHNDGSSTRPYTVEQKAAVIRVRKCSPTAFYDILGLETVKSSCTDSEIKKAYRKLSLLTHPDKNGYAGADEAFKMVSRAFQILSDADKKAAFDRTGGDPDSRFSGASSSSAFSGFSQASAGRGGGPMFEEEISPEEMFRQFFGGGMGGFGGGPFGGGLFDTGPGFVFNMGGGGPGIRMHQFGGGRPRVRPHNHANAANAQPPSMFGALQNLLPLILIFIFPLLSSIFSSFFGSGNSSGPSVRFDGPVSPLTQKHVSTGMRVPYWVSPVDTRDYTGADWRKLDKRAEERYVYTLRVECNYEEEERNKLRNEAFGFFFTDRDKLQRANQMEMRSCNVLDKLSRTGRL